jgi:predicted nuclease of predicted toxin-antitoxin system
MRVLIDAQLPPGLCGWFRERGVDADHVADVLGGQTPDAAIADHAKSNDLVLITKDDDFRLRYPPGDYRLVWLRCGNITNRAIRVWLEDCWPEVQSRLDDCEVFVEVR